MLILERKAGEKIVLTLPGGEVVTLEVAKLCGNHQVVLGLTAPRNVPVLRAELVGSRKAKRYV